MIQFAIFIGGFIVGAATLAAVILWYARILEKEQQVEIKRREEVLREEIAKIHKIKTLFAEATKISDEQTTLASQVDMPSKSASHSKYKNSIIRRMKELEEKKLDIFQTILDNGVDPVIVVSDGGELIEMKMSEVLVKRRAELLEFDHGPSTDSKNPRERVSHLKLVSKEEQVDDGESTTSDRTLH